MHLDTSETIHQSYALLTEVSITSSEGTTFPPAKSLPKIKNMLFTGKTGRTPTSTDTKSICRCIAQTCNGANET